jgi:CMP/dCMP kinase
MRSELPPQPSKDGVANLIIAIDGGAGTGTSSAAKAVAKELGVPHLNTGELYRGITYAVIKAGLDTNTAEDCYQIAKDIQFKLEMGNVVGVNGEDVRGKLHLPDVNAQVYIASSYPEVREIVYAFQREYAHEHGAIMEGRAIAHEFPQAQLKFFFVCDPTERVRRLNLGDRSHETLETLKRRDEADTNRAHGAFKKADDAVELDTTNLSLQEVVDEIVVAARQLGY